MPKNIRPTNYGLALIQRALKSTYGYVDTYAIELIIDEWENMRLSYH